MNPPRLATWLLQRCGIRESIVGDLLERFRQRPSRVWFWRQALVTILFDLLGQIRDHKLVVVRAVAMGIAIVWFMSWIMNPLLIAFWKFVWNWTVENNLETARALIPGPWLQPSPRAVVWFFSGWIVARTHRPYGVAAVFALGVAHVLAYWLLYAWFQFALDAIIRPPLNTLASSAYWLTMQCSLLFIGGLMGANREAASLNARRP
jgi:hypothetical protein